MGKVKNELTKNEMEILYRVYKEFLLEQEIVYGLTIPNSMYVLFEKIVKLRGKYETQLSKQFSNGKTDKRNPSRKTKKRNI